MVPGGGAAGADGADRGDAASPEAAAGSDASSGSPAGAGGDDAPRATAVPPGRYRHYKGPEYEVVGEARHSETEEVLVVYRALYGEHGLWVRPRAMWLETVVVDGTPRPRFARIASA